jgi:lipopolysaccharide/colanic/teichoic acid biosynthesis glycosyltransferase
MRCEKSAFPAMDSSLRAEYQLSCWPHVCLCLNWQTCFAVFALIFRCFMFARLTRLTNRICSGLLDKRFCYLLQKSLFDCLLAVVALLLLSPLLFIVALLVRWRLGAPVIFLQQRAGYRARHFKLLKFRTMFNACDASGALLPDAKRLTPFGRWLRATSIDELPALINVLRGEMSFIGPRPLLVRYLPLYSSEQARRHDVKPGFSGWAQINGRNALSWEEKFRLDVWYVDHQSFRLDLYIFVVTIWKVIRREGISADGEATMPPFTGC